MVMPAADDIRRETERYLHAKIPLARAMGVEIENCGAAEFVLTAPLAPNHNHLGTAFGGSLAAIATLAGYGFLWILLGDRDSHIVIRDSSIRYHRPVRGRIRAVCVAPGIDIMEPFLAAFRAKGKARISLDVTIAEDGETCVSFTGEYVALR